MLQAFVKLIAITVGTLFLSVLAVIFVRWMGSQQVFKAPPHAWFERPQWKIVEPDLDRLCSMPPASGHEPLDGAIYTAPVKRIKDQWMVDCKPEPRPLSALISGTGRTDWLIRVRGHDTWGLDDLIKDLRSLGERYKFAIAADAQKVSMYLRKHAPEMLFAADSAILLRFQMFESLWIETAMDFWPDFVIVDFGKDFHLDARGAAELQRRGKRIIWHKTEAGSATPPPQVNVQGTMTAFPE